MKSPKQTALHAQHNAMHATFFNFAGFLMPIHFGAQMAEHHAVRQNVGMFDVSHMSIISLKGPESKSLLGKLLCADISKISVGQALYSCMLNDVGGIIDDLIIYQLGQQHYQLVVNAATSSKDMTWITNVAKSFEVDLTMEDDLSIIALQGPKALAILLKVIPVSLHDDIALLKPFEFLKAESLLIAKTGYTGENGYEIILTHDRANVLWSSLLKQNVMPCGLGARDTLRLEAGLCLYGTDMTEKTTPFESNLGFTVALSDDRSFIGKKALLKQKEAGPTQKLVGVLLENKGVLRAKQAIFSDRKKIGEITSGTFSPTLKQGIGLARINWPQVGTLSVKIRDKYHPITLVKPPFVRFGRKAYSLLTANKKETL